MNAAAGLLWLLAAGFAVGLAIATRLFVADGTDYVLANQLDPALRLRLVAASLLAALALAAGPALAWLGGRISEARLRTCGERLAPLLPLALASLLLDPLTWQGARLGHLLGCVALAFAAQRCVRAHRLAPPLAIERRLAARIGAAPSLRALRDVLAHPRLPLALVLAGAFAYGAWFSFVTLQAHANGYTRSYDLAIFDNLMWNLVHGEGFLRSTPAGGGEYSHFGRHATLLAYALAPFYAIHASAATLLVLQAALLGLAALPLFAFLRFHLRPWAACALAFAYLLYAPLHGSNLYDFHFLTLAPFVVFCLAHALETRSRVWLAAATLLVLTCREDVALAASVLGAYHVLAGRRVRAGLVLAGLGAAWFTATKLVLMPMATPGASYAEIYQGLLPAGETGFGAVLETLLGNPGFTLGTLLERAKLEYALLILAPLAFAPLRRPLGVLFALPGLLFTLLSTAYPPALSIGFQYTAFWTPYLFVATGVLLRADRFEPEGTREARAARTGWWSALALATLVCSVQYGAIFQQSTAGGGFYETYPFTSGPIDVARRALRAEALAALPPDASVAASESVAPHVSNRAVAYTLREGVRDAEYVVFGLVPEAPGEHALVRALLVSGRFGVVSANAGYAVLRRGAPTRGNARLNARLRVPPPEAP